MSILVMFYTNPVCPHVPGGIKLLKKQVKDSLLFVDALVGNPIMVDLLSALPVDAFIIDWRLNVVVDARTGRAQQSSQGGADDLPNRWRHSISLSKSL